MERAKKRKVDGQVKKCDRETERGEKRRGEELDKRQCECEAETWTGRRRTQ